MKFPFDRRVKHLRILLEVRHEGPLRFNEVQNRTGLTPTEVQRHLRELVDDGFLHPRPYAKKGRKVLLEYELSRKGEAHLDALDAYRTSLEKQGNVVGQESLNALRSIYT